MILLALPVAVMWFRASIRLVTSLVERGTMWIASTKDPHREL
jgi:hypothetical protein